MAPTGSLTISGSITGLAGGDSLTVSLSISFANAVGEILPVALPTGGTTVTIPSGTTLVIFQPAAGNTVPLTIKGVVGDAGLGMHLTNPTLFSVAQGTTSFVISVNAGTSGTVTFL